MPAGRTVTAAGEAATDRAWVVGLAVVPPLPGLVARLVAFGVLGTPADPPAGADWS